MDGSNWLAIVISAVGGAVIALGTAGAILYGKIRSVITTARKADADQDGDEQERVIARWRALNGDLQERYDKTLNKVERDMAAMAVELEKRRLENIECQRSDAVKTAQLEYLTKAHNEKVQQIDDLRARLTALEQRP